MTLLDHVYTFGLFDWKMNTDEEYANFHLKATDAGRSMKSELINGRSYNAWPRGIWAGWPR